MCVCVFFLYFCIFFRFKKHRLFVHTVLSLLIKQALLLGFWTILFKSTIIIIGTIESASPAAMLLPPYRSCCYFHRRHRRRRCCCGYSINDILSTTKSFTLKPFGRFINKSHLMTDLQISIKTWRFFFIVLTLPTKKREMSLFWYVCALVSMSNKEWFSSSV